LADNATVISTVIVGVIIVGGIAGYAFYSDNNALASLSQQNNALSQQAANLNQQVGVLEQRTVQVVTMTNTVISVETTTSISTETNYVTNTVYSTETTTSNVYPPSSSTYALTYVTGNSTETYPSCGGWTVAVDVTYEMHQQISSNIIQWAQFPSGQLMQPTTQTSFINQAYLTVYSTYSGNVGVCGGGGITNLYAFITDTNNNQLSPSTYFIVQGG
jgi:hypothetical protein